MRLAYKKPLILIVAILALNCPELIYASSENETFERSSTYLEAKSLMKADDFKTAIDFLIDAQANSEDTFEVNELLIESYQARIAQVGLLKKRGLAINMRKAMEHSLVLQPKNVQARKNLINFHLKAPSAVGGSKDKARELIKDIPGLTVAERYVYEALINQAENDHKAAIVNLDKALNFERENAEALIMKGNIQIEEKAYADAILTFETCTSFHPENMGCHYLIGKVSHVGNIQVASGISALETFISSDYEDKPLMAHAHYRLGEIYARSGDKDAAKKHLENAVSIGDLEKAKSALNNLN